MRIEVHVHGIISLRAGTTQSHVETALRPWLDYIDEDSLADAKSVHQDEPGINYDHRRRALEICWTGDVGRNFRRCVEESLQALSSFAEQTSVVEISYYHDDGQNEFGVVFVGPTPEAIHDAQRRRMLEDVSLLLSRHFGQEEIGEVVDVVNRLFARNWDERSASGASVTTEVVLTPGNRKHLH
jgi:hypothetical protein